MREHHACGASVLYAYCMHCSVTIRANLYQASASRRDEILAVLGFLDMHGGISPSWLEVSFRYYMPSSTLRNLVNVR